MQRIVRFGDTDAAGVIHFHHLFRWCHEAWEESLDQYGLQAIEIFPSSVDMQSQFSTALPIVHCEADFLSPIRIGDKLQLTLLPRKIDLNSFQIEYIFKLKQKKVAIALVRHRAIDPKTRHLCGLSTCIDRWLEASTLNRGISPL